MLLTVSILVNEFQQRIYFKICRQRQVQFKQFNEQKLTHNLHSAKSHLIGMYTTRSALMISKIQKNQSLSLSLPLCACQLISQGNIYPFSKRISTENYVNHFHNQHKMDKFPQTSLQLVTLVEKKVMYSNKFNRPAVMLAFRGFFDFFIRKLVPFLCRL